MLETILSLFLGFLLFVEEMLLAFILKCVYVNIFSLNMFQTIQSLGYLKSDYYKRSLPEEKLFNDIILYNKYIMQSFYIYLKIEIIKDINNNMSSEKINQILKERKQQRNKVNKFRKQRIFRKFNKQKLQLLEEINQAQKPDVDEATRRRMKFYNDQFQKNDQQDKPYKPKKKQPQQPVEQQRDPMKQKIIKLKDRKKKFIKKMQTQKTSKGQPIMRNYVKYALTKLQQTITKQKMAKRDQKTKNL